MSYVREAVIEHVRACKERGNWARGDELGKLPPRIPVSQIGHCPRQAIFEAVRWHPNHPLHVDPTHPFDDYVMEIMECGNVWEHQTGLAMGRRFGESVHWLRDDPALRVGNEYWSGHIDFLVQPCEVYPAGAIIEHKATNPVNFVRNGRLPYEFHCLQVLTYERLLREQAGLDYIVPTYLYYRSWNNWAELRVWDDYRHVIWEGEINGKWKSGEIELPDSLDEEMDHLEYYWRRQELPPRYETPTAKVFSCARVNKTGTYPSCQYFGACWPELPQEGPLGAFEL